MTRFRIDQRYAAPLAAFGLTEFRGFMDTKAGTLVGVHSDRTVTRLRVEIDGQMQEVYLKRTLKQPVRAMLLELIRGRWPQARPMHEYEIARKLDDIGIPAMKAIGCGQRTRGLLPQEAFILAEAVPARISLYGAWRYGPNTPALLSDRGKRQVIPHVAGLVRRLHDAGLRWPDMVAKHILLDLPHADETQRQGEASPSWNLHLIDLERMHRSHAEKTRRRDLRILLGSMPPGTISRTDLLRFARAYCGCPRWKWSQARSTVTRAFRWATPLYRHWRSSGHDGNAGRVRGRYIKFQGVTLDDRYIDLFRRMGVTSFKGVFAWEPPGTDTAPSWNQCHSFELKDALNPPIRLRLHRFDRPPWSAQFRRMVQCKPNHSLAWWRWRWARKLDDLAIPTADPIAFGEKMRGLRERRSFALFRDLDGPTLANYLQGAKVDRLAGRTGRLATRRCAELLARLHKAGIFFRDNPAQHIVFVGLSTPDPQPHVATLSTLMFPRWRRRTWQLRNLAALAKAARSTRVMRMDQYRFVRAYLRFIDSTAQTRAFLASIPSADTQSH